MIYRIILQAQIAKARRKARKLLRQGKPVQALLSTMRAQRLSNQLAVKQYDSYLTLTGEATGDAAPWWYVYAVDPLHLTERYVVGSFCSYKNAKDFCDNHNWTWTDATSNKPMLMYFKQDE